MKDTIKSQLYEVIWCTRRLFQQLRAVSEELHEDIGVSASQRAVLVFLEQHEPQTVPQIARDRSVSRQHVQAIVNELLTRGLVEAVVNPSHKRSSLIKMTSSGKRLFNEIKERETKLLEKMETQFSMTDLQITIKTLQDIDQFLKSGRWRRT